MNRLAINRRNAAVLESIIIIGLALVPLFSTFPYRVNIFLTWEGAFRLSEGQMPYRDFGTPLGFGFWLIPALFFKIFGPYLISLIKAQVLINIMGGFAFRSIMKSLGLPAGIRVLSVLLFVLSYSFFNFWPWYNHTVIIYELIGLAFLLCSLKGGKWRWLTLFAAAFFTFLSFFTKQDGGGLALLLCLAILGYHSLHERRWTELLGFVGFYILVGCIFILPFVPHGFGYWFNHGQPPHNSRLAVKDFADEILNFSQWLKFYFLLIVLLMIPSLRNWRALWADKQQMMFLLVTVGILVEAAIFQVTSYTPPDNNIFFHSFAFAFIFTQLAWILQIKLEDFRYFAGAGLLILLWWSGTFYKYIDKILTRMLPPAQEVVAGGENVVSRNNFMINTDTTDVSTSEWIFSSIPVFKKIYMPPSTVHGMDRLMDMPVIKSKGREVKVLNLSELTPLDQAIGYKQETGHQIPLWHHLGVGMFNRQLADYNEKIRNKYYDVVVFEYAPTLNNFFPFAIRDELKRHYRQVDSFLAPRRPTNATIEVYVP
ncbi:hypothetical protein [Chitinophaga cymbidii]|uniref:Glycosyltransferase RgtA/B/C/D-like domain-containing protein n=1 Tax=Chitinophaga cymbidii TaxID=1096750 RepID=A0A512RSC9_9BACT|nr:hypothetical protein [Chitinophaga cymbidii]GEP98608.1 hypothetical protein CCY01nite_48680 [Chitinophaga cymbidii]